MTVESARTRLTEILETPGFRGFAALSEEDLVGAAVGNLEQWDAGRRFSLRELFVDPDVQGQGIGRRLLEHLLERLREASVRRVYLLTSSDGPARSFYESSGFSEDDGTIVQSLSVSSADTDGSLS
ncbi:GNAT family N-acetyltransferase [Halopiger goleimassiliensis]|uniref:GNAT family N-acetyltransferase n=1 Tax=Halopiger goleimassiliensis TaxID=1293048 RepID=UPI000677D7BA|nr:GNAT family N-acetyltransferase [Halopiger goleimassiliensis]